jgi:activating signal cointegrator complex subunit 1
MGKKKGKGEYNDFLDGEKLRDNDSIRATLQGSSSAPGDVSPPPTRHDRKGKGRSKSGDQKRPPLTHFLCYPLVNETTRPEIQKSLERFREEVAEKGVIPPKAVRPVGTLHLTLGVMSVPSEEALQEEIRRLQALDLRSLLSASAPQQTEVESIPGPLTVSLRGLVPMQSPRQTSILYATPVDATGRLQKFSEGLKSAFGEGEEACLVKDSRPLKLHATIVNTIYAKSGGRGGSGKGKKGAHVDREEPQTSSTADSQTTATALNPTFDGSTGHGPHAKSWLRFDASELIEQHQDFVWADGVAIDRIHICKMGAKKILNEEGDVMDEQYEVVATKLIDSPA